MNDLSRPGEVLVPIGEALPGMRIVSLPDGMSWVGALMFIKTRDNGGKLGTWAVRCTEGFSDEELLGVVTLHAETLREQIQFRE